MNTSAGFQLVDLAKILTGRQKGNPKGVDETHLNLIKRAGNSLTVLKRS